MSRQSPETSGVVWREIFPVEKVDVFHPWGAGIAGGFVSGVGMGIVLHVGANIMPYIGALYGWPTVLGGWIAHLVNSILIGLLFTFLVSHPSLEMRTTSIAEYIAFGIVYAAAVGIVTSGVMLPLSMNAIGTQSFPEPLFPLPGVFGGVLVVLSVGIAHVVYGLILGGTYGIIHTAPSDK